MSRFYIAASIAAHECADALAGKLRGAGHLVTSCWHDGRLKVYVDDLPVAFDDPRSPQLREEILRTNLADLERAEGVIALTWLGSPRATYAEIGYALALGKRVFWVRVNGLATNIFDAHPLVRALDIEDDGGELDTTLQQIADAIE